MSRWRDYCDRQARSACGFEFHGDGTVSSKRHARAKVLDVVMADGRSRKSGVGRLATAVLTQGANIMLASGYRGVASVTIVTEVWTHTEEAHDADELQRLYGLAVAARAWA